MKTISRKKVNGKLIFALGILILLIMNLFLSSCGTARRGEPIMGKMIEEGKHVQRGELVFMENCERCHPGGEAGVGPAFNNVPLPGFAKRFRVRSKAFALGLGRMPSFKKHEISKEELNDLLAYMRALRKNDEDAHGSVRGKSNYKKLSAKEDR